MITNDFFVKARLQIKESMLPYDNSEGYKVLYFSFINDIFIKSNNSTYQILGINSSFVDGNYIEIFVAIDIINTMKHFDERAVKTFYFNSDTIEKTYEISESEIKSNYNRAEWRRFQKYVKKEKPNIVKNKTTHTK